MTIQDMLRPYQETVTAQAEHIRTLERRAKGLRDAIVKFRESGNHPEILDAALQEFDKSTPVRDLSQFPLQPASQAE